jgi:hypothetical protein
MITIHGTGGLLISLRSPPSQKGTFAEEFYIRNSRLTELHGPYTTAKTRTTK